MSKMSQSLSGEYHIQMRIKGNHTRLAANITLFHAIMTKIDSDWPWKHYFRKGFVKICDKCLGGITMNPRFEAQDIKAAAKQSGINIKIFQFKPLGNCCYSGTNTKWGPNTSIIWEEAQKLLRFNPKKCTLAIGVIKVEYMEGNTKIITANPPDFKNDKDATKFTIVGGDEHHQRIGPPMVNHPNRALLPQREASHDFHRGVPLIM